ncbi:MAG: CrcB family protein [Lentilactobacillus diolivorans]|jgi:CrcB protein|nr:CrcB family protein [Lentilactobacillus diolivorans]RRG03811.1 MAG: CrcB family protein [Lactobacillus sp.]
MSRFNWQDIGQFVAIFIGGAIGGVGRYELSNYLNEFNQFAGTTAVNLIGCFLMAIMIYGISMRFDLPEWLMLGLGTGVIGGFTTFSALMLAFITNYQQHIIGVFVFLTLNLIGGFLMALFGYLSAKWINRGRGLWS